MKIIINFSFAFILIISGLTAQENLTISKAIKNTLENNLDIKYFHANAEDIPRKNEYYDLITCNFLFHEVPKDRI